MDQTRQKLIEAYFPMRKVSEESVRDISPWEMVSKGNAPQIEIPSSPR
jgi:hypothetical protein